jgi:hypothetical protein
MIANHIQLILVVTGVYTAAAILQFFAPRLGLTRLTFGADSSEPFTLLLAQHWALLAGLLGGLLVYAGYHPEVRGPVMLVAAVEKLGLAGLVLFGRWPRTPLATRMAVIDVVIAVVFLLYLGGI